MIVAWMVYAFLVGALSAGAAQLLERLLRSHRKPTRWVWALAMGFSALWPLWAAWRPPAAAQGSPLPGGVLVAMEPLAIRVEAMSVWHLLELPLLWAWAGATVLLVLVGLSLLIRTRRLRRGWVDGRVGGRPVLLSRNWGPAVVGLLSPRIVLPRWCQDMEEDGLSLILDHEVEHLRAGDLRLLVLAGIPPVLLPWSLPLWWMWRRLRLAVEGDCDLRVLRKNPQATRAYLELLLEVGRRMPQGQMAGAMLSESERTLERRIKIMTMPFPRKPLLRGAILVTAGLVLIVVACLAPSPTALEEGEGETAVAEFQAGEEGLPRDLSQKPAFTPFTVGPDIKNRQEVARAMEENYPPLLREAGIGGTATIWFFLDETGAVQSVQVNESSGHPALDDAAMRVAEAVEFTPALNREEAVPVWISLPITFTTR